MPKTQSRSNLRWQLGLAFMTFIMIGISDGGMGIILPSLGQYYNVSKSALGLLFLTGTVGYLTAALISSWLLIKLGRQTFLTVGSSSFLAGVIIDSFKPPFVLLLTSLLLIAFGVGIVTAGLNTFVAALPHNTTVLNYLHAFYGVGALLGPIIATGLVIVGGLGWNSVYWLLTILSALILLGFATVYQEPAILTKDKESKSSPASAGNVMLQTMRLRVVWLAAFFLLFYVGTEVSMGNWAYSYLTEYRHFPDVFSGWSVSSYWLGLTLGRFILGRLGQRYGKQRLIQSCLVGVAAGLVLVWFGQIELLEIFGLALTGFSLGPIFPTTLALMPELVPQRILQSAISFLASLGALGAAFFPWLAGNLAQATGLWTLLPYAIVLTVLMCGVWLALQSRYNAEVTRLALNKATATSVE